ncbi:MAG: Bax inhibitor-1/YccA family protein [Bacilli bacterium]|nr:Bax inhibitor-1/YccA family protein [Bacilli bacterium]
MDNKIYSKVFGWLFVGLMIVFLGGYLTQSFLLSHLELAKTLYSGIGFWIIIIVELALAFILSLRIRKMNSLTAKILYILYCIVTGFTFSSIFIMFQLKSIIFVFLITAVIFGIFAIIGSKLNVDLSKFGLYLFVALIGIIIVSIINIFLHNSTLDIILSIVSILVFTLYIGYDIKIIKEMANTDINEDNLAIYGAFQLLLDFINIFIRLLELFGDNK